MDCSTPGLPVHHQLPEFTQTHVHWVGDAIQPSLSLSSPSPPTFNFSQHQGHFLTVQFDEYLPVAYDQLTRSKKEMFSSVQSLSRVWLFATPWITAHQVSLSITNSWSSPKLKCIELVMPSSHLILCRPLLLLPPVPPSIRAFPMSQLFTSGGQSIGVSASASALPMNTQNWFPLRWTGWISLLFKGLSRVFSNTTVQKHPFLFTHEQLATVHPLIKINQGWLWREKLKVESQAESSCPCFLWWAALGHVLGVMILPFITGLGRCCFPFKALAKGPRCPSSLM